MAKSGFVACAVLAALLAAAPSHAQDTLKSGDVISGRLRVVKTKHPNGTPIEAFQIVADNPRKLPQDGDFCEDSPSKTFHLSVMDDARKAARLKKLTGKKMAIVADDFFCSHTAWHIGDAVVIKWRFAEPGAR